MKRKFLILLSSILAFQVPGLAHFRQEETEDIPAERVITNLTAQNKKNPKDAYLLLALGRAHAIAAVQKEIPIRKNSDVPPDWKKFGWTPDPERKYSTEPYFGVHAKRIGWDRSRQKPDRKHLKAAADFFEGSLKIDSTNHIAKLGLGWVYQKLGERNKAIPIYRELVSTAWPAEKNKGYSPNLDGRYWSVVVEAGEYLLQILDPTTQKAEIEEIRNKIKIIEKNGSDRAITPIIFPLHGKAELATLTAGNRYVTFDLDGSGPKEWQWPNALAAFLVYIGEQTDPKILSGLQLFGNVTFWIFWSNGYEALRALDDDQDGNLKDNELRGLGVWNDVNHNGQSEPGEVISAIERGITQISLSYKAYDPVTVYSPEGISFRDGRRHPTYDWVSNRKPRK